jgi:hypothetical protein
MIFPFRLEPYAGPGIKPQSASLRLLFGSLPASWPGPKDFIGRLRQDRIVQGQIRYQFPQTPVLLLNFRAALLGRPVCHRAFSANGKNFAQLRRSCDLLLLRHCLCSGGSPPLELPYDLLGLESFLAPIHIVLLSTLCLNFSPNMFHRKVEVHGG